MNKTGIRAKLIIRIMITAILIILGVYANFIAVRRMTRYAAEAYFYDKLSVAYDIGGMNGLKSELEKIKTGEKWRHGIEMAGEFEKKLGSLEDPKVFIDNALSDTKRRIELLRNLRIIAIALILAVLLLRFFVNRKII